MKKAIMTKILYQVILGTALSFLYMQIRPYEAFTLSWPFAFLASWFLLLGWFNYLKYDKLSIFEIKENEKKRREAKEMTTRFKMKSFFDYVNTPLQLDADLTDDQKLKIKMYADFLTALIFLILTCLFF